MAEPMPEPFPVELRRAYRAEDNTAIDVEYIRAYLEAGNDVNKKFTGPRDDGEGDEMTLLSLAVKWCSRRRSIEMIRVLVSEYGADLNVELRPGSLGFSLGECMCPLFEAIRMTTRDEPKKFDVLEVLVRAGVDVNIRPEHQLGYALHSVLEEAPKFLRVLLLAGARIDSRDYRNRTAEEEARWEIEQAEEEDRRRDGDSSDIPEWLADRRSNNAQCHAILKGARLAGSYRLFALQPHLSILVLRALARRGNALPTSETSAVARRLVDAAAGATPVPDAVVFHVLTYWLGTADSL
mmetsp:Transcript_14819/g.44166  ORF Transcript_14819/g.44166 Transcript_14819/m.44166 type:complete len:295 (+) Transcript_14819:1029-1913(+)